MKSLKFISIVLGVFLIFSCASAPPAPEMTGSSVWRISRDGNTMYLAGSVHVLREHDFPLPPEFDYAFSRSQVLVLEADVELMATPEITAFIQRQMFLPNNQTLRTVLSPEVYAMLEAKFAEYGIPLELFANIRPSMVTGVLSMISIQEHGFTQEGIDVFYLQKAKRENKTIKFLESVESQINILVSMGEGYEDEYIIHTLQDMDSTEAALDILMNDWRHGLAESSEASLSSVYEQWPSIYRDLITDRHEAWMPQIEEFIASGTTHFVIAGLLHMHGQDGLLPWLESAGYTVEQVGR